MPIFVLIVSVVMLTAGISLIIHPRSLMGLILIVLKKNWIWPLSALRVIIGILFLMEAPECRFPMVINVVGVLIIIAGLSVPFMGSKRLEAMAIWFMEFPDYLLRVLGLVGMLFGVGLALAALN